MKTTSVYIGCVALCLLPLFSVAVNAASGSASGSAGSKNAIAKVLKVTPQIDNKWIVAVKDPKSPTGYSVKVIEFLNDYFVKAYFIVFMFARSNPGGKLEYVYSNGICNLLDPNDKKTPKDNFLPRQILNTILPGRYGNCNLTDSTEPMKASATVNTDPETNKGVNFPKSSPFELEVNILSARQLDHPETEYFFQVVFSIGGDFQASGNVGGSTNGKSASAGAGASG